jgi:acyl-CoA thioesterase-2
LLHACAVTYVSDLFLLSTALPPHGLVIGDPSIALASLDHAVWFRAPFRADDWLLYVLVASVMQEGLVRRKC